MSENEPLGHVPVDFPREIPMHSVMHIAGHLRGTETLTVSEGLQHAGVILGCSGKLMESEGPTPVFATADCPVNPDDCTDEELADCLESACAPQAAGPVGAFPAWLIPIVLEVLRRLIEKQAA